MKGRLGIAEEKEVSRTALLGMLAIRQAMQDAALDKRQCFAESPLRLALVSGTTVGGMDITERYFQDVETAENVDYFRQHDCGNNTQLMADYFGCFADVQTISTACSSAANALMVGAEMIRNGEADIVVAGGTEALSQFHLSGFNALMILDKEPCRPFDATRAGLNLGEGAAYVVLESEESARNRNQGVLAYLTGYANTCDAFHQTASSENGEGAYRSMTQALQMAGLQAGEIAYVNAHGTGTPNNDQSETVALRRVFGESLPPVSSTKSFTGHTTSASGSIESVICLLAMQHGFFPANIGWKQMMDGGLIPTLGEESVELPHVLCNSFGFGGNDTSLIFSLQPKAQVEQAPDWSDDDIEVVAQVEIADEEQLSEIKNYVGAMAARRMGKLMKASLLSSLKALEQAGIECPDAIIAGTAFGLFENSEHLLDQLNNENDASLSPTLFMQSTHNTIAANIAIHLKCHGYNSTYVQEARSLDIALQDAKRLLKSGKCKSVLVGLHDETTPRLRMLLKRLYNQDAGSVYSLSLVVRANG